MSGLVASVVAFVVGAVMDMAVTTDQHGFNLHTVGVILVVAGTVGALVSLADLVGGTRHPHRPVAADSRRRVMARQDVFS